LKKLLSTDPTAKGESWLVERNRSRFLLKSKLRRRHYVSLAGLHAMRGDKENAKAVVRELLRVEPDNAGAKPAMEMLQ
jgi:hypothetical protein